MAAHSIDVPHGEASPSSSPPRISFVKSIDRKARSYLKTLERSFTFSVNESKGEDPSTMTIEFLRARLQAQRAEYKAEKQRSQLLAKKVLELEQRLSFEVEQRRKAECSNMQWIPPNYHSSSPNRLKDTYASSERGFAFINSKFKDNSSGEEDPSGCCSEICGREGYPDRDGVFLISPSSLQHRWESLRGEHQLKAHQHGRSQYNEAIDAAFELDKESFKLKYKELRGMLCETSCDECASSMEVLKSIADQDSTEFCAVTTDCKEDTSNTSDYPASEHEKPSEVAHNVFGDNIPRQASASFNADKSFKSDGFLQYKHTTQATTHHPNNYLARPSDSCQNCQPELFQNPIKHLNRTRSFDLSSQKGVHVQNFHEVNPEFGTSDGNNCPYISKCTRANHDRMLEYIVTHSSTIKQMQEERASSRPVSNQVGKSKYAKDIASPKYLKDFEISTLLQCAQKPHSQEKNAAFSTCRSFASMETRYGRKLHGRRMSLDGGLDRLQNVSKEICRALGDGKAAKFPNDYHSVS